jgi:hypothetical protein
MERLIVPVTLIGLGDLNVYFKRYCHVIIVGLMFRYFNNVVVSCLWLIVTIESFRF